MKHFLFDRCVNGEATFAANQSTAPSDSSLVPSRCNNISFTKNPEKYFKYRPEEVEEMIGKLFDTSA